MLVTIRKPVPSQVLIALLSVAESCASSTAATVTSAVARTVAFFMYASTVPRTSLRSIRPK